MRYSDRAVALRPDDQALLRRRVGLDVWAGNLARAAETLRALTAAKPDDPELKRELDQFRQQMLTEARSRAEAGDVDAAMQRLEHYRASGGDETIYRREREEQQAVAQRNAPKRAAAEKRWSEAERLYREQLAREPNAADLRLRLADVLIVEGKKREAAQAAAKAADLAKGDADMQVRASEAFAALGRPAEALKYVDRALALRRNDLDLQRRRAKLAAWAGKNAEAAASLKVLIAADPSDLSLKRDLGRIEGWLNHLDAAARLLSEYLAQNPNDLDVLLDLARLEARRGKRQQVAELLQRYREAGGNEATFRHELAKSRAAAAKPAAGAAAAPGAAAGGASTGPPVPPEVIKAEQEKRYGDAERLIRGLLAAAPQRVDLWIRLSQVLAAEKKTRESAAALAKAADLQPDNIDLQLQAASGFGSVDRPADALRYVDRALAARPNDLALHKRRVLTANWAGKYAEAEESQRVLIAANPADLTLQRDLGRILGWAGRAEQAADILADYLERQPADTEALLELSRLRAGQGNSQAAAELLDRYRAAGGNELTYRHELSLVLAWSGRWYSALTIADAGLAKDPNDFTFRFARAVTLYNGYETGLAGQELERLAQLRPNAPEVAGLRRTIDIAQRSYVQMDLGGKWESDNVATQFGEISYHQPVGDGWWLVAGGRGDPIEAPRFGAFAPIQGGSLMARGAGYLGAQARLDFGTIASARLGATGTGRTSEPIYQITADSKLSDEFRVQLSNMRDLFVISPRAMSLGLTQVDTVAQVTYTPDLAWSFGALAQEDEISDRNHAWHVFVSPRRAVLRSRYWNVDLGISGNWYGYTRKPAADGYYAPSLYQGYQTSAYIYYKMSEESGLSLVVSYGVNKDETLPTFKFTQDYAAEATFGALSDLMWKIRAGYSNHGSLGPNFSAESVGMTLVKRF